MARDPLAAPESCTALPLIGHAAVMEELPCHAEINRPTPAEKATNAKVRRIFGFMPRKHSANQETWHMRALGARH